MSVKHPSLAIVLSMACLLGVAYAQPIDSPPTTPTGVSGRSYSSTAGVISWGRSADDRLVVGYELTRNGRVLGTFDALSYVDRSLQPERVYRYTIVAVDTALQRSAPATVYIFASTASPAPPTGLRAETYTPLAVALFWDASAGPGDLYMIERNGESVGFSSDTSFRDDTLFEGGTYRYKVFRRNRRGEHSAAVRVTVNVPEIVDSAGVTLAPPAEGLRSSVYSSTAAELFWRRASIPGLRYEIRRDGVVLATTGGTSFFDDTLADGRTYEYDIVTIDRRGRRTATAPLVLSTIDASTAAARIARLGEPVDLRAEIYSSTTAELFWTRPTTPGLRYQVLRDGELVGTTNGISFVDDTLGGERIYHYAVIALDRRGRESRAATLVLSTREIESASPLITLANYYQVLSELPALGNRGFRTAFGSGREGNFPLPVTVDGLPESVERRVGLVAELPFVGPEPMPSGFNVAYRYRCGNGGNYVLAVDEGSPSRERVTYEACSSVPALIESGAFERRIEQGIVTKSWIDRVTTTNRIVETRDLTVVDTGHRDAGPVAIDYDVTLYERASFGDVRTYEDFDISIRADTDAAGDVMRRFSYRGTARFRRTKDDEPRVFEARTPVPFTSLGSHGNYEQGRLVVMSSDGSLLEVDAETSDPATYRVTVRSGGITSSVTVGWLNESVLPCLNGSRGGDLDNCN